jgi:predicted O-linked N-acetylglucosamine transferase (SPINDLY family)
MTWDSQAYQALLAGNYGQVGEIYEQLLGNDSETISYYWYLGLAYLLQEQEEEAQMTWLLVMSQGSEEEIAAWQTELITILDQEAQRQKEIENYHLSWLLRGHIREINPILLDNLLQLISLEINLNIFSLDFLDDWQVIDLLKESNTQVINSELLLELIDKLIVFRDKKILLFIEVSFSYFRESLRLLKKLEAIAFKLAEQENEALYASELIKICLKFIPDDICFLNHLSYFYKKTGDYQQAIEVAKRIGEVAPTEDVKIYSQYLIISSLQNSGRWLELKATLKPYKKSLQAFMQTNTKYLDFLSQNLWLSTIFPLFYFEDNPQENRVLQNQVAELFQNQFESLFKLKRNTQNIESITNKKTLKIGYISDNLRRHPIGFLSRWLIHYHEQNYFELVLYLINQPEDRMTETWFRQKVKKVYNLPDDSLNIFKQIQADEIDILVDLESLTSPKIYTIMALKPAPIQVTWLGFDASGLPAIDYYLADPYVLPDNAQEYYREKIWRLPSTYLAINGFEIGVPNLHRRSLDIPENAIIYFSAQNGLKRHPDTIRLQMKIIQAVPSSYFLIKGLGDSLKIQELFQEIATQEGVKLDRLRFLEQAPIPEIHRANLSIADVVLDTYPYNGATTTLEVLWMGIPLVTKVGQQFAARNSYTFMINAGISEGIAWTDEEYINWGIRLGTEEKLRQQINWKLRQSRQTSPLWNAQQFTRDIEQAYQQMWQEKFG